MYFANVLEWFVNPLGGRPLRRSVEADPMFRMSFTRSILIAAVTNTTAAVTLVGPMLLAAAGVAALLFLLGAGPQWPWFAWIVAAPVVYLGWVIIYLGLCASSTRQMGRRYPKPRHFVRRPGHGRSPESL